MTYDRWKSKQWLELLSTPREPLVTIITTHLLVEHSFDYLLSLHVGASTPILNEVLGFSFARKAKLVYQLNRIPKELYDNITKLNILRNDYAHNLDVDFAVANLDFHDPEGRVRVIDFSRNFSSPPSNAEIQDVIAWIGLLTFGWLHNIIVAMLPPDDESAA